MHRPPAMLVDCSSADKKVPTANSRAGLWLARKLSKIA